MVLAAGASALRVQYVRRVTRFAPASKIRREYFTPECLSHCPRTGPGTGFVHYFRNYRRSDASL
jgi:hypothetical protein